VTKKGDQRNTTGIIDDHQEKPRGGGGGKKACKWGAKKAWRGFGNPPAREEK